MRYIITTATCIELCHTSLIPRFSGPFNLPNEPGNGATRNVCKANFKAVAAVMNFMICGMAQQLDLYSKFKIIQMLEVQDSMYRKLFTGDSCGDPGMSVTA